MSRNPSQTTAPTSLAMLIALGALLAVASIAHSQGEALEPLHLDAPSPAAGQASLEATEPAAPGTTGQSTQSSQIRTSMLPIGTPWLATGLLVIGLACGVGAGTWALRQHTRTPRQDGRDGRTEEEAHEAGLVFSQVEPEPSGPSEVAEEPPPVPGAEAPEELPAGVPGVLKLGQAAVDREDYETGATWFRTALDIEPGLAPAHLCLGLCLEELGDPDAGLGHIQQAIEADPTDAVARYTHAQLLARHGHGADAMDALALLALEAQEVREAVLEDPAFTSLRDHPRFLAMLGAL